MKHLLRYMILFGVLLTLPLAFVAWRTYGALEREAESQVRFFAEQLLDGMEAELADLVRREEGRAVDAYQALQTVDGVEAPSPLNRVPLEPYILGYFQNNPDGSFQTPMIAGPEGADTERVRRIRLLEAVNRGFNARKQAAPPPMPVEKPVQLAEKQQTTFAERYLNTLDRKKSRSVLGQEEVRLEQITAGQAMQLARQESNRPALAAKKKMESAADEAASAEMADKETYRSDAGRPPAPVGAIPSADWAQRPAEDAAIADRGPDDRFQAEVAPLQAVAVADGRIFIFRRIAIDSQIYRQGLVLDIAPFLEHLLAVHYDPQPIARYTRLRLSAVGVHTTHSLGGGDSGQAPGIQIAGRVFPAPFAFLMADMRATVLPASPARHTLTLALVVLGVVMVAGLVSIYKGARSVLDLSERRSRFVSAVTHELKTPLTNIRMYIEMLEQGIATTLEREQDYLAIVSAESTRLSGLIHNVLELSRLEKKTRRFDIKDGDLSDVLADVGTIMAESLAREGFTLAIEAEDVPPFAYDREVLVQVLINLMENSIKFGSHMKERRIVIGARARDERVCLTVSDTGPGIPRQALKRVFDDFYRVDDDLSRNTGGTGIGLALVKKFVQAMNGRVWAENNDGPGCTIHISLPARRRPPAPPRVAD